MHYTYVRNYKVGIKTHKKKQTLFNRNFASKIDTLKCVIKKKIAKMCINCRYFTGEPILQEVLLLYTSSLMGGYSEKYIEVKLCKTLDIKMPSYQYCCKNKFWCYKHSH